MFSYYNWATLMLFEGRPILQPCQGSSLIQHEQGGQLLERHCEPFQSILSAFYLLSNDIQCCHNNYSEDGSGMNKMDGGEQNLAAEIGPVRAVLSVTIFSELELDLPVSPNLSRKPPVCTPPGPGRQLFTQTILLKSIIRLRSFN